MIRFLTRPDQRSVRLGIAAAAALAVGASGLMAASSATALSPDLVLSEVYGGGGNSGATYTNDFIEIYNPTASTIDVSAWSVQYASATGSTWQVTPLVGTVAPGQVYLVQEAQGSGGTTPLPPPDATGTIAMSATAGKVALVTSKTSLTCGATCHADPSVRDYIGYGATANDFETAPAPGPSNPTSDSRDEHATDTDNNAADFTVGDPSPKELPTPPPPPVEVTIPEIQGAGHLSPYADQPVQTSGVVTARSGNGYWIQDPTGDADVTTSDGIFVFTNTGGAKPAVSSAVTVTGTVDEFRPGSQSGPGLNVTEITGSTFVVDADSAPLPAPTVIGRGGLVAPKQTIDDDSPTRIDIEVQGTYQPDQDAIDFYEELEGMLVEIDNAQAVGPTNDFGEIVTVPAGKTGYLRTPNGGVVYGSYATPNPRRIMIDDVLIPGEMPAVNTGDVLPGAVIGPMDYDFSNFRIHATAVPAVTPGGIQPDVADAASAKEMAVATFNVENLDPTDPQSKFDALAAIIVHNLRNPDVLALEEVQDNNGATDDGTVAADQTLSQLVAAISAAGGPTYLWRQIDPQNDQDGGEPGGNIRVAFLFQDEPELAFVDRGAGDATTPTQVTEIGGETALTLSPGRVDPLNPAWAATRKPLAGEFTWRGKTVFVIANHFSSKGGDEPLFGRFQPPDRASETKRAQQAASVNGFVEDLLASDPDANVVVVGDLNDYQFSATLDVLTDGGDDLADLINYLPPGKQYTYVFEGNSQVLDHILVSPALAPRAAPSRAIKPKRDYEVVHVNADFAGQVSDHDPQVVRLRPTG